MRVRVEYNHLWKRWYVWKAEAPWFLRVFEPVHLLGSGRTEEEALRQARENPLPEHPPSKTKTMNL